MKLSIPITLSLDSCNQDALVRLSFSLFCFRVLQSSRFDSFEDIIHPSIYLTASLYSTCLCIYHPLYFIISFQSVLSFRFVPHFYELFNKRKTFFLLFFNIFSSFLAFFFSFLVCWKGRFGGWRC